jgi:tetratricopeptide (TPR) repeat protein
MAIAIEGFTVVVQNKAIVGRYPGGREAFKRNAPNQAFCADEWLSSCSFMVDTDAVAFFNELGSMGLNTEDGSDGVICDSFQLMIRPECDWLQIGRYKQAVIAWITGEDVKTIAGPPGWCPDTPRLKYATKEEAARRLKFLRSEGNVHVFWDSEEDTEVFVGRTEVPLDLLFAQAGEVVTANLRNPGCPPAKAESMIEIQRAVEMLEVVVEHAPQSWRAHWMLGKAWHALDRLPLAHAELSRAFELEKEETVIPRELSGICLELGLGHEAVQIMEHAIGLEPQNAELLGNLAVAHLISGSLKEAQGTILGALKMDPDDKVNQTLHRIIGEVATRKRAQPRNLFELMRPTKA